MSSVDTPAAQPRAGLIESAIQTLFARSAVVVDVEPVGPAFRIVTLEGEALKNVAWTPGDKIQIQLGGWVQRTYTPMDWDAVGGRTRLLVYLNGDAGAFAGRRGHHSDRQGRVHPASEPPVAALWPWRSTSPEQGLLGTRKDGVGLMTLDFRHRGQPCDHDLLTCSNRAQPAAMDIRTVRLCHKRRWFSWFCMVPCAFAN
jgi:hypothetical protein